MEVAKWQKMLLTLSKLQHDGSIAINGSVSVTQQVKKRILTLLNIRNVLILSPVFGELMIRVASKKTKHSNISTSISPKYYPNWSNINLLEAYGVMDKHGHDKSMMTAFRYGSSKDLNKLWMRVKNEEISLQSISETVACWNKKEVIERFNQKSRVLLLQYEKDTIGFHLSSVKVVYLDVAKLDFDFVNLLKNGKITCESRMYLASEHQHCQLRGFRKGSLRNHGFGWRIKSPLNNKIFTVINVINIRPLKEDAN